MRTTEAPAIDTCLRPTVPQPALPEASLASPETSPLFTRWIDPTSGVESWVLARRVAPVQQTFYFTNPSLSRDGRYLWMYCAFPPGGDAYYGRQLAVVDFVEQTVRHYPETQFMDASPFVDADTAEVYWVTGLEVWKRGPRASDVAEHVTVFPSELASDRRPLRIATHLGFSADRRALNFDAQIGNQWFVGDFPLDGSAARVWQMFDRCYNHGQFSPTDPDVQLIAQDGWHDASTGRKGDTIDRLWLIRRGEPARPLIPDAPSNNRGHEWWDADGEHVWYIDYRHGTERVNIHTGLRENIWPSGHTHSHSSRDGQLLVGDIHKSDHWRIAFFNRATGREVSIVMRLPELTMPRRRYHVHPHPQFCAGDGYVAYTTNVLGGVDVALVSVAHLLERTA